MKRASLAAALLLGTTAAHAQDNTIGLREALGLLPEFVLTNPSPDQVYFLNVWALRQLADGPLTPLTMQRVDLASGLRPVDALRRNDSATWLEKSGIDIEKVDYFAGFGTAPQTLSLWGLDSPETADALLETLAGRGFEPTTAAGVTGGLANGVPMNIDLAVRDPANPWLGDVGQTSVVAARGKVLLQSGAAEPVAMLQQGEGTRSALDNIVVATALGGIDQAAGDMWLVQAMLVSPAIGLGAIDPADALLADPGNIDEIIANTKARIAAGQEGIPPFLGGFIADMQFDAKPAAVISLTYPDCATAALAGPMIEARWAAWPQSANVPAKTMSIVSEGAEGTCAAVVTIVNADASTAENPASRAIFSGFVQRQFPVLQIGLKS